MARAQIMIVEDERIVAMDIRNQVKSLGYDAVAIVARGEEAIEQAAAMRPDLVLMDINLRGEMDGIEAACHIQAKLGIPIVYLTAYADQDTLNRAKVTEPYAYIPKPFGKRDLHTAVEMALHKHDAERRLRESEQWLQATLQSIGDGVVATDSQRRIKFMNPVAQALTGWTQEEAVGKDFDQVLQLLDGETGAALDAPVAQALAGRTVIRLRHHAMLVGRDGTETTISDSAAPILDDDGSLCGSVMVFQDISEMALTQERLRQYAAELETRNRELDAFAHTVAHDIKDPLNTMISCATVLRDNHKTLSEEQMEQVLEILEQVGTQTCNIVDELLLLSAVRSSQTYVEPLCMADIVSRAQKRLAYLRQEYSAQVSVPEKWPVAMGYGPWVEEVWVNYISNAIKYGGEPPQLELGATVRPHSEIEFWVRDNGPGIDPDREVALFTPFTQLDGVRATGHGLGLSIARRIVEKLGGSVGVRSRAGEGSTFTFTLPAA